MASILMISPKPSVRVIRPQILPPGLFRSVLERISSKSMNPSVRGQSSKVLKQFKISIKVNYYFLRKCHPDGCTLPHQPKICQVCIKVTILTSWKSCEIQKIKDGEKIVVKVVVNMVVKVMMKAVMKVVVRAVMKVVMKVAVKMVMKVVMNVVVKLVMNVVVKV